MLISRNRPFADDRSRERSDRLLDVVERSRSKRRCNSDGNPARICSGKRCFGQCHRSGSSLNGHSDFHALSWRATRLREHERGTTPCDLPFDGSSLSETAIEPATEIAKASNAEIVFTDVLRLPFFGVGVAGIEYGGGDYAGDFGIDAQKVEVTEYLNGFVLEAKAAGLNATASVRTGSPSQQIVDEAAEAENSIVVMVSHGSGGLKRWVVGSVADKVI